MNNRPAAWLLTLVVICISSFVSKGQYVNTPQTTTIYFPDLFYKTTDPIGDTTFSYEYRDKNEKTLSIYDVTDGDQVGFVKFYKVFHTPMPGGPSNVSVPIQYMMLYEYAHPTRERWVRYNREIGEMIRYKSYKDQVVGSDTTTITEPKTGIQRRYIFKYYKTEIIERSVSEDHDHGHEH